MRITQVIFSPGWGGAERLYVELCLGLADAGCVVQCVVRDGFSRLALLEAHPAIHCVTLPARGNWDLPSLWKLKKAVRDFAPDVIHAHLARATWMVGRVGQTLKIPVLTTTHNRIKPKYFRRIDAFSTITRELAGYLQEQGVANERIRPIPNFSLFPAVPAPAPRHPVTTTLVSYGRFVKKKGFEDLLRAMATLVASTSEVRLLLGGDGPEKENLLALCRGLGLEEKVEFRGWVDDPAALLAEGDLFVLPSRDEPFGIVVLEAMAAGKTIVTTRTSGPVEVLDAETAWFAAIADPASLGAALQEAVAAPEACFEKAERALALYRSAYTRDAVLPRFLDFYRDLAAGNKGVR